VFAPRTASSFEHLVRAHSGDLYRFAYWQCRDRFLAEDLVQETFTRAWKSWETLRDQGAMKSWLYTILRHEIARMYERKRLEVNSDQDVDELPHPHNLDPLGAMELREAVQALPILYREPLLLQVLGGFSCAEIAAMLSINEAAAMTRLSRARSMVRRRLEPNFATMEKVR